MATTTYVVLREERVLDEDERPVSDAAQTFTVALA